MLQNAVCIFLCFDEIAPEILQVFGGRDGTRSGTGTGDGSSGRGDLRKINILRRNHGSENTAVPAADRHKSVRKRRVKEDRVAGI